MDRRAFLKRSSCLLAGGSAAWGPALAYADAEQSESDLLDLDTIASSADGSIARTISGAQVALTLDPELQSCTDKLLALAYPLSGAGLIVDAKTGHLLACSGYRREKGKGENPLLIPAPAASVFKLVTTAALLGGGHVTPNTRVCFSGGERQIKREHLEPPANRDTCPPFKTALGFSRNAVYAQLATQYLMRDELMQQAEKFGFNRPLPFDAKTTVGTLDLPYNDLEFARASAGFVGSDITPIGAAHLALTVAHEGQAPRMRLVKEASDESAAPTLLSRAMSTTTAWRMTRMMEVTVHSGTSLEAFSKHDAHAQSYLGSIRVAGKTGTLRRGSHAPTTSWFTGFAPSRDPKVVVAVLLQNGPLWRRKANEVARDLLRACFAGHRGVTHPFDSENPGDSH